MSLSDSVGRAARVVPFPERSFKPNAAHCFSFVDETGGHPAKLFELANAALLVSAQLKGEADRSGKPQDFQKVVDTIGVAFFALGTMLGIPPGTIESCAFGEQPVVKQPRRRVSPRFATIKTALSRQTKDLSRAHRRWSALVPTYRKRGLMTAGAVTLGAEPLRLLQAILDRADLIALDVPVPFQARQAHLLVTLPAWLLDKATAVAAYDEDDEETDGGDDQQDLEPDEDGEFSLGFPDAVIDQSRQFPNAIQVGDGWQSTGDDLELDHADHEPSLAGTAAIDQRLIGHGDMRDREEQFDDGEQVP